ncbi:predicted protein [Naegleria gruberi]|uniref:Predicted protein n=1 Tax=Naegleria gruberi TaxID=5762 RepID=D2VH84_NAEGR|nr:uncharacterized protein NAEGRDRAFT_68123 [Naegleria gruberi]EFC43847.1 predicted protein [Naegleria gruberi]|eukprot:XP_002676591.1 predicted protein [Naegleria gruberi strain NEG-M]
MRVSSCLFGVIACFLLSSLLSKFFQVDAIPNYVSKLSIVKPVDRALGSNIVFSLANVAPADLCVLDNEDIIFREGKFLKRYYASTKTVSVYLLKTLDVDDKQFLSEVLSLKRNSNGQCIYIEKYSGKVKVINHENNTVSTLVTFGGSSSITIFGDDEYGNLVVYSLNRIKFVNTTAQSSTAIAGNQFTTTAMPADGSNALSTALRPPSSYLVRNGIVYFTIYNSIMKIQNGTLFRVAAEKGSWSSCSFNSSYSGLAFEACVISPKLITMIDGEIYFSDNSNSVVRKINREGNIELVFGFGKETIDLKRSNQTLQTLGPNTFTGISIIPYNNNLKYYMSLPTNIITVDQYSNTKNVAGFVKEDLSLSTYIHGFQFSPTFKPIKTYRNGDFIIIGQDKRTVYRLKHKSGLLKPLITLNNDIYQCIVDKSTREDLFIATEFKNNTKVTNFIYKFNIYSKLLQLIAGNSSSSTGYQYDGQSSLDISITEFLNMQYLNGCLFFSYGADQHRIFLLDLSNLTIKKVFGVGYQEGISLSGLYSDAKDVKFDSLLGIMSHPITGTLYLRTSNIISYIDNQNRVMPLVGRGYNNLYEMPRPSEGDLMPTSAALFSTMIFHPVSQNFYFAYQTGYSSYIFERINSTTLRTVFFIGDSVNSFVIRKSNGNIYYLAKSVVGYDPTNDTHTTIASFSRTVPKRLCLLSDDTLVFSEISSSYLSFFNLTSQTLSTRTLNRTVDGKVDYCTVTNILCFNDEIYVTCSSSLHTKDYYIAKLKIIDTEITPVAYGLPYSPISWTIDQNGTIFMIGDTCNQGVYKVVNGTKIVQIAGQGLRTPSDRSPLSKYGWTIAENGDIYFIRDTGGCDYPIRRVIRDEGVVVDVLGNGTITGPKYFRNADYINSFSEFLKDGTYYGETKSSKFWYDPKIDAYFVNPTNLTFKIASSSFNQDGDVVFIDDTAGYGLYSYIVDCERDKYGYCLQNFTCFGVFYNNDSACFGNGDCTSFNGCECFDNYYGDDCSKIYCFGILSDESNVCNGNGKCVDFDICECKEGYNDNTCSVTSCFGILSNSSLVCSGNGSCFVRAVCNCNEGSTGLFCNETATVENMKNATNNSLTSNTTKVLSNDTSIDNSTLNNNYTNTAINNSSPAFDNTTNFGNITEGFINNSSLMNNTSSNNSTNNLTNSSMALDNSTCTNCSTVPVSNSSVLSNNSVLSNTTANSNTSLMFVNNNYTNTINNSSTGFLNSTNVGTINDTNVSLNNATSNTTTTSSNTVLVTKCFGYEMNDSRVCSGNGNCTSNNTCQCNSLHHGLQCELLTSFTKTSCFGKLQADPLTCSGNGFCVDENNCQCNVGFIGTRCFAQSPQPTFNSFGNTLEFHMNNWQLGCNNSFVECSKLLLDDSLTLFGNNPSCFWKDGNFYIELGGQHSLLPFLNITLNVNALDNNELSNINCPLSVTILPSNNPVKPIISVAYKKSISPCEEILIDASGSYCGDLKPVKFIWSIESSPDPNFSLEKISLSNFNSTLNSNNISISGMYVLGLIVESSLSGSKSEKQFIEISKSFVPHPTLSMLTSKMSLINIEKSSLPIVVKKSIELPACYFENKEFEYIWYQASGSTIDYQIDVNNDLVITGISNSQDESFLFGVKAISKFNSNSNATLLIPISSKSRDLSVNIYLSNLNTNQAETNVEYSDPDNDVSTSDSWTWSCFDRISKNSCQDSLISNILNQCSNLKSPKCTIQKSSLSKVTLTLSIQKGIRYISKSVDIDFPSTELLIPPVISLISVKPNRVKVIKGEVLSLQLSVILGGDEKYTTEDDMIREWTINGATLTDSMISKMSVNPSKSSSLILSLSTFIEDTENEILFKVTDRRNNLSSIFSYKFKLVKSPKSCLCYINPSYGYALETQFSFSCPGCQNTEKSIDFVFGFIDDKSGTKIPLYNLGEKFSSYLPSPFFSKQMDTFVDIVDLDTGASVEFIKTVEILTPAAASLSNVKSKVKSWQSYAASYLPSDSAKLVFNSATISRTSELMIAQLSQARNLNMDVAYGLREEMINSMAIGLDQKSPLELISDIHFSVYVFGLESLISNCHSIESLPFDKFFNLTERIINLANQNTKFRVAYGVETLCNSLFDNIIRLLTNCSELRQNYRYGVLNSMKKFTNVLLRNYNVGQKDYHVHLSHFSIFSLLSYKNQMKKTITSSDGNSTLVFNRIDPNVPSRSVLETSFFSVEDYMGVFDYLNQISTTQNIQVSEFEQLELKQSYRLLTKIVFLDKVYAADISFTFNIRNDYNFSNINVNNYFESSGETVKQQKTNIISTLECIPIDNLFSEGNLNCSLIVSNSLIHCNCSKDVTSLVVVEKTLSTSTITLPISIPNSNQSNSELYGLFGLLGLGICCCCCVIISILVIIIVKCLRRKKQPEIATKKEVELMTV